MIQPDAETRIRGFLKELMRAESACMTTDEDGNYEYFVEFHIWGNEYTVSLITHDPDAERFSHLDWVVNVDTVDVNDERKYDLTDEQECSDCLAHLRALISWGWL